MGRMLDYIPVPLEINAPSLLFPYSDFLESLGDNQNIFTEAGIPVNTTEKFFLTAADPSDGTNEDRLTQVINAKFEAGFLKPYNYVNGYSRLQKYMDSK